MVRSFLVSALFLALAGTAFGQTPYVENHLVTNPAEWLHVVPIDYTEIPGSSRELTLPAGTVLISWTCTIVAHEGVTRVRPFIGGDTPAEGTMVRGNRDVGVFASGYEVVVSQTVVRNTRTREKDGVFGRGLEVSCSPVVSRCARLHVTDSLLTDNASVGIIS